MVNNNPQISAEYFHLRATSFSEHVNILFQAEWHWRRIDAQRRASQHQHGHLKAKEEHNLVANSAKGLLGFLAKKKLDKCFR